MKETLPFVSVIIVTYNGLDIIKVCLPSLTSLNYPRNRYEIIFVDNASEDATRDFLKEKYPKVKVVANKKNLGYVGINSALQSCKGEYIYFTNNDVTLNKDCLINLVKVMERDSSIAMAAHKVINYYDRKLVSGGTWVSRAMYGGHFPKSGMETGIIEIPYMGAGLIRKSVVDRFGYLLDPDYFIYAEDIDLGLRIRLLGMRTVSVHNAVNYHMHALTVKKYSTKHFTTFLLERNTLMTFFKVFSVKTVLVLLPYILLVRAASILKDLASFRVKSALARVKAVLWVIFNFGTVAKKRSALQRLRTADDRHILKIFTEKWLFKKPFIV